MNLFVITIVIGMLVAGTCNTIMMKSQFKSNSKGSDGTVHSFNHAWVQTWVMFIGEALNLIVFFLQVYKHNITKPNEKRPGVFQPILIIPMLCDLAGSTISSIGLLPIFGITSSVWQMLRGSNILFTGMLSLVFLRRKLYAYNWAGMSIVFLGIVLVGLSSMLSASALTGSVWMGLVGAGLIIASQAIAACQMVVEEVFLKRRNLPALQVVGTEGTFGVLIMSFIVLPIVYFAIPTTGKLGSLGDNAVDAFVQMANNHVLFAFVVIFAFSIAFYNFFAQSVTKYLTAVHRTLIDACRNILVWTVDLFIYYAISETYGEAWLKYSLIQVAGFVLLILGTVIYNRVLELRFLFHYEPRDQELAHPNDGEKAPLMNGNGHQQQYEQA